MARLTRPAARRAYVVQAHIAGRSVPTFYLLADVQGIVDVDHARRVALDVLSIDVAGILSRREMYGISIAEVTLP